MSSVLSISFFMPIVVTDAATGRQTFLEIGRGSWSDLQLLYISGCWKKVRLTPEAASDFLVGLDTMARNVAAGWSGSAEFFNGTIEEPEGAVLSVCLEMDAGRPWLGLDDYRGELKPEDLDYLNESCKQGWPLARGGRRGTGRGKLLAQIQNRQARQQAMRDQNQPQRSFAESYSDWIDRKCGEY